MDDLAMTCSDFVNALKMLICSEKHPVSRANYGYTKKVCLYYYLLQNNGQLYETLSAEQILTYSMIF